jgi:outer membrane protein assembly factor BamB
MTLLRIIALPGILLGVMAVATVDQGVAATVPADSPPPREPYWPQWRGPHRDAVSADKHLLTHWPEEGPPRVWTASGLGSGYSSVVVVEGRIYTMGDREDGVYVICLDDTDGSEIWSQRIDDKWGSDGPRSTPTTDGEFVYALSPHGGLVCLTASDGETRWQKQLKDDFGGRMMSGWGYSESPLIDGELLVCTPGADDAAMAALDRRTGETVWLARIPDCDGAGYASIVKSEAAGIPQYITLFGRKGGVAGVRATDGELLWRHNGVAGHTANIPTPIVRGDLVFYSTGYNDGGSALLRIVRDGNQVAAEEVYTTTANELRNHHGGMVLVGEYLYGGHGQNKGFPFCIHFETGERFWERARGAGTGSASVIYADGRLYFRYENGVMALIDADPESYRLISSFEIPNGSKPSWAHPVVAGQRLYLRDKDRLLCLDLRDMAAESAPTAGSTP